MPELPEVETICRKLREHILGMRVTAAVARRPDLRIPIPKDLRSRLVGRRVTRIARRSKYVLWDLDDRDTLILHLGMSGRLFFTDPKTPYDKHDHVVFEFSSGLHLRFRDPRRFG